VRGKGKLAPFSYCPRGWGKRPLIPTAGGVEEKTAFSMRSGEKATFNWGGKDDLPRRKKRGRKGKSRRFVEAWGFTGGGDKRRTASGKALGGFQRERCP